MNYVSKTVCGWNVWVSGWNVWARMCVVKMCGQECVWLECVGENVCGWNVWVRMCVGGMCG